MELSLLLAEQILALFLMGLVGFVIVKSGKLKSKDSKIISNIIVYICSPCVIIDSFQIEFTPEKLRGLLLAGGAAVLVHILLIGGGRLLTGPLHLNGIEKASIEYSNAGYLIIPLVSAVLGKEWVFYTTAYIVVQTILIWTHGQALVCQGNGSSVKNILLNPNVIAIAVGILLFATGFQLPTPVAVCVGGFGDMVGTVGMLVIGMVIGDVDLLWVFKQKRPYFICLLRLVIFPAITILLFKFTGLTRLHPDAGQILLVVILATSAPAAVMITQMAQIYDKDSKYASVINVMSVIFCIVTMPLMVLLYETII